MPCVRLKRYIIIFRKWKRELESLLKPYWDNILVSYETEIQAKAIDSNKI